MQTMQTMQRICGNINNCNELADAPSNRFKVKLASLANRVCTCQPLPTDGLSISALRSASHRFRGNRYANSHPSTFLPALVSLSKAARSARSELSQLSLKKSA